MAASSGADGRLGNGGAPVTDLKGGGRAGSRLPPRPGPAQPSPPCPGGWRHLSGGSSALQTAPQGATAGGGVAEALRPRVVAAGPLRSWEGDSMGPAAPPQPGRSVSTSVPQSSDTTDTVSLPDPKTCLLCNETIKTQPFPFSILPAFLVSEI